MMATTKNPQMSFEDICPDWYLDYSFIQSLSLDELLALHNREYFLPKTSLLFWELLKVEMINRTK
jgi:hypothetical protein